MFDGGACTVSVRPTDFSGGWDSPLWSGVLDKGGTSPSFAGSAGDNLTVSVSVDGVVTLDADVDGNFVYAVDVVPDYSLAARGVQAIDISAALADSSGIASNMADVTVSFVEADSPPDVTPNSATLTSADAIGARVTNGVGAEWS